MHHAAMEQNLCHLLHSVSCMSLSTQLLALVHVLSRCYAPAAHPECRCQNTTAISCTIGAHAPAVIPGYLSKTVVIQAHSSLLPEHQVVGKSYLHSACGLQLSRYITASRIYGTTYDRK